ncbi:uncharacterized protein LOC131875531 [Cryptomeria japonica]|uniref:uncharacterized protein LOC131875531 n=1 Tax=Cryptomeria japonica TaxID=3369 RepID=UPI0025AB6FE6|nr:uncharacterized protein LOC131875531 [Cryptomeria japonica]
MAHNSTLFLHKLDDVFTVSADFFTLACFGVFTVLIGYDIWRAFKKRATWLPGYLLPGMAAPSVRAFLALAITICAQLGSELLLFRRLGDPDYNDEMRWSKIANLILFICIIVLGLILCCTILASKTIQSLLRQRISAFLSITEEGEFQFSNERMMLNSWYDFGDEVLMSWFVARACQADYVISRSVFSSAVGIVVTISLTVCLLSNTSFNKYFYFREFYPEDIGIAGLLFSFIIIGWLVIFWRWLSAQLYFRLHKHSWRKRLCLEEFWTSHTVELIGMYDLKGDRQRFLDGERDRQRLLCDKKSSSNMPRLFKLENLPTKIFTKVRLHKLLYIVLMLQISVVFFSKVCGLLSDVIVGKFLYCCRKHMRKRDQVKSPEKYARILKCICMPGEDPSVLWEANEMSFNKAKRLMDEDCEKSKSIFHLCSPQWAEDGRELLNKLRKKAPPLVLEYFPSAEKQCVKMTVVSLLAIFIRLDKAKSDPLMKACRQVWDLLTFADECDIDLQVNNINLLDDMSRDNDQVCMAADREFYKLQMEYDKLSPDCQDAHTFLRDQLGKCEESLKRENLLEDCKEEDLSDSKDWLKIAPCYALYKLCSVMLEEVENDSVSEDFVAWTEASLRNIISCCVAKLPDMLVKQCWKWAQEFEEDKLWEAIHLAGKCRGMMEAWGLQPKPTVNTTKQWTIEVEESPSQGEHTE